MHGKEYAEYFERLLRDSRRRAFVLSEKTLFDAGDSYQLIDEADTSHYNACILICDRTNNEQVFERSHKRFQQYKDAFLVLNPLWNVDLGAGIALPDRNAMDSGGGELFFRHPIYEARMQQHAPLELDETDSKILYWAMRQRNVAEIAALLHMPMEDVFQRAMRLESAELVQVQNISRAMTQLQSYYATQEVPWQGTDATLSALWKRAVQLHGEKPLLIWPQDESVFTYEDVNTIARMAASFLQRHGVQKGERILIDAVSHPEFFFLFWGAVLLGAVVIPVNPDLTSSTYASITEKTDPALILFDPSLRKQEKSSAHFAFATPEESDAYKGSFSELLPECEALQDLPEIQEDQPAAILLTSGSTGSPKGVILSHGSLFRSAQIMDRAYGWKSDDRFLSGGNFHTMSGLRNPCIAILHSGGSVVIPGKENSANPLSLMNVCVKFQVSILNVTPAFLAYWSLAPQKAKFYASHRIRMVLSTGSALLTGHRELFQRLFGAPVFDYYGLTETSGACILQNSATRGFKEPGIGLPFSSLVKVADENGNRQPVNTPGELAIYNANLMTGYLGEERLTRERIRDGWLMTGDTARINSEGCVVLMGRRDRMLIDRNGENVYPEEIERAICSVNGVADAYVTHLRDEKEIEHIAALIQMVAANSKNEEIVSRLREELAENIPAQHVPSVMIVVDEIPKSSSGKVSSGKVRLILETRR